MELARSLYKSANHATLTAAGVTMQLILPPVCRLCDEPVTDGIDFCDRCATGLALTESAMKSACPRCGVPRLGAVESAAAFASATRQPRQVQAAGPTVEPADETPESAQGAAPSFPESPVAGTMTRSSKAAFCVHCRESDIAFDRVISRWSYRGVVCDAVVAAKYCHQLPLGDALGRRLGTAVSDSLGDDLPDTVTFVPSNVFRQLFRGGNAIQGIAEAVAKRLSLFSKRVRCRQLLRTTRRIKKQAWLDDDQRRENVRGAFALKRGYALTGLPRLANQHILLVDDVLTTGATASEVSRVLLAAGADRVTLAVVARAIRMS